MKIIKTKAQPTLKEQFRVGDQMVWHVTSFDGRISEVLNLSGTVVKVNRVTVDVLRENGDVVRLDKWDIAQAQERAALEGTAPR
jgi:hypothetical protein